jgi:spore germination protein KB
MEEKEKINSLQVGLLTLFLIKAPGVSTGLNDIAERAHQDSWLSIIFGLIIGLIPLTIYLFIAHKQKKVNIIALNEIIFGKWLGIFFNIILIMAAFIVAIAILWDFALFISTVFLINTPTTIITFMFVALAVVTAIKGIEVISRTACLLFLLYIFFHLAFVLGLLPYVEINNIKPILENGFIPVIHGGLIFISISILPIFLLLIIPLTKITDIKKYNRSMIFFYLLSGLTILNIIFLTISVLGINLIDLYHYPVFSAMKKISFLNFIERIEGSVAIKWIFVQFITGTMAIYFIKEAIKTTFKIKKEKTIKIITFLTGLIILIIPNFIFPLNIKFQDWLFQYYGLLLSFCFFLIPLVIFIRLLFKIKKVI